MIINKTNSSTFDNFYYIFRQDTHSYTEDDLLHEIWEWQTILTELLCFKKALYISRFSINNRLTSCLAKTFSNGTMEINGNYLKHHSDPDSLHSTLGHEAIHTLQGCFNHQHNFKIAGQRLMNVYKNLRIARTSIDIGYLEYLNTNKRKEEDNHWKIVCTGCGQTFYKKRACKIVKNPKRFQCGICHGKFNVFELRDGMEIQYLTVKI